MLWDIKFLGGGGGGTGGVDWGPIFFFCVGGIGSSSLSDESYLLFNLKFKHTETMLNMDYPFSSLKRSTSFYTPEVDEC